MFLMIHFETAWNCLCYVRGIFCHQHKEMTNWTMFKLNSSIQVIWDHFWCFSIYIICPTYRLVYISIYFVSIKHFRRSPVETGTTWLTDVRSCPCDYFQNFHKIWILDLLLVDKILVWNFISVLYKFNVPSKKIFCCIFVFIWGYFWRNSDVYESL